MSTRSLAVSILLGLLYASAGADDVLYRYEGDVLPYHESAGWDIFDPCEEFCAESVEEERFVLSWLEGGNFANYHLWIARPPDAPPLSLGRVALPVKPALRLDLLHLRRVVLCSIRSHPRRRLHVRRRRNL